VQYAILFLDMEEIRQWKRSSSFHEACGIAWRGLKLAFKHERNLRLQLCGFVVVMIASFWMKLSAGEMGLIALSAGIVISFEMANSAIELLANIIKPEFSEKVRDVKDVMAGAVLVASLSAILVGIFVFGSAFLGVV